MGADLHIHMLTEKFPLEYYAAFNANTLDSMFFNWDLSSGVEGTFEEEHGCDLYLLCAETPQVWVGEVSWLKAALLNSDEFIPEPIGEIAEIIGERFPIIDDVLIEEITKAMSLENSTGYALNNAKEIINFLEAHRGEKAFTISW